MRNMFQRSYNLIPWKHFKAVTPFLLIQELELSKVHSIIGTLLSEAVCALCQLKLNQAVKPTSDFQLLVSER